MPTFVTLSKFTDQGIRDIKGAPERYQAFRSMAEKMGVKVKDIWYTVGSYDIVAVCEGTGEDLTALLLKLGSLGNVRTETMRGFSPDEIKKIIGKL